MESDDDYQLFSPPEETSPPVHDRKLKRLKKATRVSNDEALSMPRVDSSEFGPLESPEILINSEESNEPLRSQLGSEGFDGENGLNPGFDEDRLEAKRALEFEPLRSPLGSEGFDGENGLNSGFHEDRLEAKRALEFEPLRPQLGSEGFDGENGLNSDFDEDRLEAKRALEFDAVAEQFDDGSGEKGEEIADSKKRRSLGGFKQKKERKRRAKGAGDDGKPKSSASTKRISEKERKAHLQELYAESQRLLRETRDAAFKPLPLVQKPISSVLEKIRQRKLELSKKAFILSNNCSIADNDGSTSEVMMDLEIVPIDKRDDKVAKAVQEETIAHPAETESSLGASHIEGSNELSTHSSHEDTPSQMGLDEESKHAFRAPVNDTQDLFCDSQTSDVKYELLNEQSNSPLEEDFHPSLLTMNLKLDSAPPDEVSDDEEDNDKENVDPRPHRFDNACSSPKGDPVKAFVDDEAVEEDDSDNDLFRFQENEEDEDNGDFEELNDLIATEYEEKPIDSERRNQLHQKWLEQQDAAGTDSLLQRLKYGSKQREVNLLEEEEEDDEGEEYFTGEASEDLVPTNVARINSRKLKQMIPQMFSDKDDAFLSSDDEETEKRLVKQRLLQKAEKQATLLLPTEDENSKEIFGLIKKLNIVPDTKKKAKTSSIFDSLLTAGNSNSSSKSSFLGRVSNFSVPSTHKHKSSMVRSFIFERDDSNSRSAISMSEDSSDMIRVENRPTRNASAKFSNSQSKSNTQSTKIAAKTVPGTSLFEILRRSSMQSNHCTQGNMVGQMQTAFAAFKPTKKSIKIEGRI